MNTIKSNFDLLNLILGKQNHAMFKFGADILHKESHQGSHAVFLDIFFVGTLPLIILEEDNTLKTNYSPGKIKNVRTNVPTSD